MTEVNQRVKKEITQKIASLSKTEHYEIFKVFQKHGVKYTQNKNGLFFNLSDVSDEAIHEIIKLLDFFIINKAELDEHEKKINECKNNKFSNLKWNDDISIPCTNKFCQKIENNKIKDFEEDNKDNQKITQFLTHLEDNTLEKQQKKKGSMKFINAKKKFSRKVNSDRKFEADIENCLQPEPYSEPI